MLKINIFSVGYLWNLDLSWVAKFLNRYSKNMDVSIGNPVRNIGQADIVGHSHSFHKLFNLFPSTTNFDIQIGLTSVPLEGNFYGNYQEGGNNIIRTLHDIDEVCERANCTVENYVIYTLVTAILVHQHHQKTHLPYLSIYHDDVRGCLFDFCGNKSDIVVGLRAMTIDSICRGKLIESNVSETLVQDVENILERLRTPTIISSFMHGLHKPVFSLLLGGLLGGLLINIISSLILGDFDSNSDYWMLIILITLTLLLILTNYLLMLYKSQNRSPT